VFFRLQGSFRLTCLLLNIIYFEYQRLGCQSLVKTQLASLLQIKSATKTLICLLHYFTVHGSKYKILCKNIFLIKALSRNSQNFLRKFLIFFVTLGLKILRLYWVKVVFEADMKKVYVSYCKNINYWFFSMDNCFVKASKSYVKYYKFA